MDLATRMHDLVDEELIGAYWASVEHFGTTDLVLYLDTEEETDPLHAFVRERLLADPAAPSEITRRVSKPAAGAARVLEGASTAFWLIVSFPGEEMISTAVIAKRLGEPAQA